MVWCGLRAWCGVVWAPCLVWCGVGPVRGVVWAPCVVWCGPVSGVVWCRPRMWCGMVSVLCLVWCRPLKVCQHRQLAKMKDCVYVCVCVCARVRSRSRSLAMSLHHVDLYCSRATLHFKIQLNSISRWTTNDGREWPTPWAVLKMAGKVEGNLTRGPRHVIA